MTEIKSVIADFSQSELTLVHNGSSDEIQRLFESKGIKLGDLSKEEGLRIIQEAMDSLSDEDLLVLSGGEIGKILGITVATATASVVAGVVAGTAIGVNYATH